MTVRVCVHCGEPIRYQLGSAKYRHVRDGKDGPTRCRDGDTQAQAAGDEHVDDVVVALDGGQEHLDLGGDL
jgi:hypothetical protein